LSNNFVLTALTILDNFKFKEITRNNAKKCIKKLDLFIRKLNLCKTAHYSAPYADQC
jgi:hypothetical protein